MAVLDKEELGMYMLFLTGIQLRFIILGFCIIKSATPWRGKNFIYGVYGVSRYSELQLRAF